MRTAALALAIFALSIPVTEAAQELLEPRDTAALRQVNTYLLQTVAKSRKTEQALQAKITMLTEANAKLQAMAQDRSQATALTQLKQELDALRRQLAKTELERRTALEQLRQERQAAGQGQEKTAALAKANERLAASLQQAQRATQETQAALVKLRKDHQVALADAQGAKHRLKHELELEHEVAQLREAVTSTQETLEQTRRLYARQEEERLALQANMVTLDEERRQHQQLIRQLRADLKKAQQHVYDVEQARQPMLHEHAKATLEADTLRDMLKRERGELHRELGAAYTKLQLFDRAIASYQQALQSDPEHAQTHYYIGLLYEHAQNNDARAVAHLQRYLALSPKLPPKARKEIEYVINMLQTKDQPAADSEKGTP